MARFEDIKFSKHNGFNGIHGTYNFKNGNVMSVIAGEFAHSIPKMQLSHPSQYRGFEVLVVDHYGNAITEEILPGISGIFSNASPEEITSLMQVIESNQNK